MESDDLGVSVNIFPTDLKFFSDGVDADNHWERVSSWHCILET